MQYKDEAIKLLSWRDPDGQVFRHDGHLWRSIMPTRLPEIQTLLEQSWFVDAIANRQIAGTRLVKAPPELHDEWAPGGWLLQHDPIATPAYPHEITALQLWHSAQLTLDVAIQALNSGWVLKDASAWNVLHSGGRPCFIDVLSLERHDGSRIWKAYAQFMRHFIIPLMLHKHLGINPHELFLTRRDGVTPEEAFRLLPWQTLWRLSTLEAIVMPVWLAGTARRSGVVNAPAPGSTVGSKLIGQTLNRLKLLLTAFQPKSTGTNSIWADYEGERTHYTDPSLLSKRDGVKRLLLRSGAKSILDLGCNAGEFSMLACNVTNVRNVLAADFDTGALMRLQERLDTCPAPISPIVLDIGRPTPAVGWCNREIPAALERLTGQVDLVMALGLIHHLIVSERIPLHEIGCMLHTLGPQWLIIEWVPPTDPRFREIAALNSPLYEHLSLENLQRAIQKYFTLEKIHEIEGSPRQLTLWRRLNITTCQN